MISPGYIAVLQMCGEAYRVVDLERAADGRLGRLPVVLRILLENVLRLGGQDGEAARLAILGWLTDRSSTVDIPFLPGRILMHDTTCGPALVDIAAMRSAVAEAGGDPTRLKPKLPVDVSTDHSVAVDVFAQPDALARNMAREMERNAERYRLMKWASAKLGVRVHPPGTGIMHTLNLERLATVVTVTRHRGQTWAVPDTMIGTDSHTPMVNGIGVLGWGVGGIEAEGVMFGLPTMLRIPEVVGVRLVGAPREGVMATDLALAVTEQLRTVDLADRFVEFFGPGVSALSAGDRAVIANMTPEFGANTGYFPIDAQTLAYLKSTSRSETLVRRVEDYARFNGLWLHLDAEPNFTEVVEIDLGRIRTSLAGPRRPQDRIEAGATRAALGLSAPAAAEAQRSVLPRAPVAIAAITSCTNTSDPRLLIAAGLVARKANTLGLKPPSWVKTSLAPGSPTAARILARAGLLADLEAIGFGIVGYGCTTCIGNSGPLTREIASALDARQVSPVAVLSGNRNFPGRVHPDLGLSFLASPPLVIAFALAGDVDRDIERNAVTVTASGQRVYLSDLWPSGAEIDEALQRSLNPDDYAIDYEAAEASETWGRLAAPTTELWPWDERSTYIRRPPFASAFAGSRLGTYRANPLLVLGDDITTDHISPAGQVRAQSDAGRHLTARGEKSADLNVFAARRGNWEVMLRGLFTNKAVDNRLADRLAPGSTVRAGAPEPLPLWRAAELYADEGRSTVIVAGERYGMGSSRDWAAKGVALLGVRAVIARGFEHIHRANLIGMGILPIRLPRDVSPDNLSLTSESEISVNAASIVPRCDVELTFYCPGRPPTCLQATAAVETAFEADVLKEGGTIPLLIRRALQ